MTGPDIPPQSHRLKLPGFLINSLKRKILTSGEISVAAYLALVSYNALSAVFGMLVQHSTMSVYFSVETAQVWDSLLEAAFCFYIFRNHNKRTSKLNASAIFKHLRGLQSLRLSSL